MLLRADRGAHQPLHRVAVLVRRARGGEAGDRVGPVVGLDPRAARWRCGRSPPPSVAEPEVAVASRISGVVRRSRWRENWCAKRPFRQVWPSLAGPSSAGLIEAILPSRDVRLQAAADAAVAAGRRDGRVEAVAHARLTSISREQREISVIASVGQVSAQAPQDTQAESRKPSSSPAAMLALEAAAGRGQRERPLDLVARAHAAPARDAQLVAEARGTGGARPARRRGPSPGQRGSPTPSARATSASSVCSAGAARAARTAPARRRRSRPGGRSASCVSIDHPVAARGSCRRGAAPARPRRRRGRRGRRRTASWRSSKHSVGTQRPAARAASSTVAPSATSTATPSTVDARSREPQLVGEVREQAADRRRHAAAVRAQASRARASPAAPRAARGRPARRRRTSRARAAARCGTGSTCRSSRAAPKCSRWRATSRMSVRSSKARMPPWPTMQPSAASASKSNARVEQRRGQDPAERAADLQRLDRCGRRAGRRRRPRTARASSCRTAPRRRRAGRSAR